MIPSFLQVAAAANALADECAGPNPPKLGEGRLYEHGEPCCAGGHVLHRVGLVPPRLISLGIAMEDCFGVELKSPIRRTAWALTRANDDALPEDRARAVVEPLRAWAKALSEAA